MTTSIWFRDGDSKYFAKIACQNGGVRVLEAKNERGESVNPDFICKQATKAYKRIKSYGDLPHENQEQEDEA